MMKALPLGVDPSDAAGHTNTKVTAGEEEKDVEKAHIDTLKRPYGLTAGSTNLFTNIVASFGALDTLFVINCIIIGMHFGIAACLEPFVLWAGSKVYLAHRSTTSEPELRRIRIEHGLTLYHNYTWNKKRMSTLDAEEKGIDLTLEKLQLLLEADALRIELMLLRGSATTTIEEWRRMSDQIMKRAESVVTCQALKAEIGKERLCLLQRVLALKNELEILKGEVVTCQTLKAEIGKERLCLPKRVRALKNEIEILKGEVGYDFLVPNDGGDKVIGVEHNEGGDQVDDDAEHKEGGGDIGHEAEHKEGGGD